MLTSLLIIGTVLLATVVLWSRQLRRSITWRAMTTPLASIIGSGFLILGPVLTQAYGVYAPVAMLFLCAIGYLFGAAIRYNMMMIEQTSLVSSPWLDAMETSASWALSFAYVVSVAYYLNLFGAFAFSLTAAQSATNAKALTSVIYMIILLTGWTRGFSSLERLEYVSVTIKLAIIAGLLIGLSLFFGQRLSEGELVFAPPGLSGFELITLGFGLIVTVQGFETSRYLGESYTAATRIKSMKWAQWMSALIYLSYVLLLSYTLDTSELSVSETAIVDVMGVVAPVLPVLLVAAALAAQFSAAVADTSGAGGLVAELSSHRLTAQQAYLILAVVGLYITWMSDVFQIISLASRAFALYYGLQSSIATVRAYQHTNYAKAAGFASLALLAIAIVLFGDAIDG
jgi:hypothetical protein